MSERRRMLLDLAASTGQVCSSSPWTGVSLLSTPNRQGAHGRDMPGDDGETTGLTASFFSIRRSAQRPANVSMLVPPARPANDMYHRQHDRHLDQHANHGRQRRS